MRKRAFIILGPESSGTKVLTKVLIKAGCAGDGWHRQRFDKEDPTEPLVVLRRSYPHGGKWPVLAAIVARFERLGYEVRVVLIVRSMQFTMASRRQHIAADVEQRAREALRFIGRQLGEVDVPFAWMTYEALVQYPAASITWLLGWCELPTRQAGAVKIKDGNKKYV